MKESTSIWVEFAKSDIRAAEKLLEDASIHNVALFHCHEAVEKILKAILEELLLEIPYIHDINKLYKHLPNKTKTILNITQDEIRLIAEIYAKSRYPSDIGLLPSGIATEEEAKERYEIAKNIFEKVCKYLENT